MTDSGPQQSEADRVRQSRRITWTAVLLGAVAVGIYVGYFIFKYMTQSAL